MKLSFTESQDKEMKETAQVIFNILNKTRTKIWYYDITLWL